MSIPKLTALIGESASERFRDEFTPLIKSIKKVKDDETPYIVFLVMDLAKEELYFKLNKKLTEDSVNEYHYFGNNSGSGSQYYLVRDNKSLAYLLTRTFNDLYKSLSKNDLGNGELSEIIKRLEEKNLLYLGKKQGEGQLNLDKFSLIKSGKFSSIRIDKDKSYIYVENKRYSPEDFIRLFLQDANKKNKFVLIVPKVITEDGEEIILSTHEEYLELVRKENKLGSDQDLTVESKKEKRICYICKMERSDVSSEYSKKFSRTGINKIFTTTTKNTSPFLQKCDYSNVYSICLDCYQKLKAGENVISRDFRSKIAGEDAFIIPQGLLEDFDYNYLGILKQNVDLAFKSNDAKEWLETIKNEQNLSGVRQYLVNFMIYRTDGTSVTVLETIEDVPMLRLEKIMKVFANITNELKPHVKNFSLGSIYRLIPVKVNDNGKQIDVGRVLSLYKAILSGEKINSRTLFDYALEGLEKGIRQLEKATINNYYNMGLTRYLNGYEDFFIKRLIFGYIVLFKACQELNLLNREIFKSQKEEKDDFMDNFETPSEQVNVSVRQIEEFLERQGFNDNAKTMFYLGVLINRVARAQIGKKHEKKPILKKIQFQGMSEKEICALYQDVVEKLIQYDKMTLFTEAIINRFHYYYGPLEGKLELDDKANVFYIMAGYSYMVGKKAPDATKEEEKAEVELEKEEENEEIKEEQAKEL